MTSEGIHKLNKKKLTEAEVLKWMVDLGIERSINNNRKNVERGALTLTKPGQILLDKAIEVFSKCLDDWVKQAKHRVGPRHSSVYFLKQLKPDTAALIISQVIIDNITITDSVQTVGLAIANALEEEVRYKGFKRHLSLKWNEFNRHTKTKSKSVRRRIIKDAVRKIDTNWSNWALKDRYGLGFVCLELFAAVTGFITLESIQGHNPNKPWRRSVVKPTQELMEWLAQSQQEYQTKYPFYLPTVEPPVPWTDSNDGGYPKNVFMRWPLVHRHHRKAPKLGPKEMPIVYKAVNRLQNVPWKVNEFVFATFDYFWKNGLGVTDLPEHNFRKVPPTPPDIDINEESKRMWMKQAHAIHEYNRRIGSKKLLYGKIHFIASNYQYQPFWFPYKLDFRGRAYPIPSFLNPQGCSLAKGLLTFASGKPIKTDEGRGWFYVHGANCWGLNKQTFTERINWVEDNKSWILKIYEDPISNRQWETADSPWEFLAWCEEYGKFNEDPNFISHIPVGMDGTNNGLQIYSLLLRDPVGAAATNVSPSDRPRDIYQEVADKTTALLKEDIEHPERAEAWLKFTDSKLPRACTKRPVMVLPYSGTKFSIREYVQEWYEDEIYKRNLEMNRPFGATWTHTRYLTEKILEAIKDIVKGAVEAMSWLREVSKICVEHKIPMIWTAPKTGFQIFQANVNHRRATIYTCLGDIHRKRSILIPLTHLSKKKQANGISPNFIHTIDAAIMMLTTVAMPDNCDLVMVHDKYASHADDAHTLANTLRKEVADIFCNMNLLERFRDEIQLQLPPSVVLPDPPKLGELNPACVMKSPYFFG